MRPSPYTPEAARSLGVALTSRSSAPSPVILEVEEVIAFGPDPQALVDTAKARGIQVPYLFFVEPADDNAVKFGL
jgi:hypothetical protein